MLRKSPIPTTKGFSAFSFQLNLAKTLAFISTVQTNHIDHKDPKLVCWIKEIIYFFCYYCSNHNGSTPLVLAKRRGVNKDAIRLLEGLEEQEVKGFNRGAHSKLETMQMADSER